MFTIGDRRRKSSRVLLWLLVFTQLSGCLRQRYDLCAGEYPDRECPNFDAAANADAAEGGNEPSDAGSDIALD